MSTRFTHFVRTTLLAWAFLLISNGAFAQVQTGPSPKNPVAAFDRGAELLAKDPFGAKGQFEAAASGFERLLSSSLSQSERAAALYNLGAARQLAGDLGPAVLALRRAELLAPATPGLSEHLAAARAAARGDASATTPPSTPGSSAAAGEAEFDAVAFARDWALSIPRIWLWRWTIAAWAVFWGLATLRLALPRWTLRPARSLLVTCMVAAATPASLLAVHEMRERAAEREVVVMADITARLEPDDLTGGPSPAGALKAGTEWDMVERRIGGNGQEWVRVRAIDAPRAEEPAPMWLPASALESVSEGTRLARRS